MDEDTLKPKYVSQKGFVPGVIMRKHMAIDSLVRLVQGFKGTVCGGYVRWMCSTSYNIAPASDVDIYFEDEADFEAFKQYMFIHRHQTEHSNSVSHTFAKPDRNSAMHGLPCIQLIKPIEEGKIVTKGDIQTILENFDFTVVRAGLYIDEFDTLRVLVDADFQHDEHLKILRLKNIHCPVGSTLRCMKYSKKGYWLPPTQAVRLFFDWDSRSPEYKDKLVHFIAVADQGEGLTQKQVDEMEAMFQVD